jgi:hypothetical protein
MKIWISYAYEDKEFVNFLKSELRNAKLDVIDFESEIKPGDKWVNSTYCFISSVDIMLVILSENSMDKPFISYEIGLMSGLIGNNSHKKIIPILLDRQVKIPSFINQYQYLDLTNDNNSGKQIEKLIEILNINQKEISLKKEIYEDEKQNNKKQRMLFMTITTSILAAFLVFTIMFTLLKEITIVEIISYLSLLVALVFTIIMIFKRK